VSKDSHGDGTTRMVGDETLGTSQSVRIAL
jgi:hypothetical protein